MRCPEVGLAFQLEVSRGRIRIVQNSHSRCGCGGARVFECVDDPMLTIERRRLTLDERDDRRRFRVQRERPEVALEFSNPTVGRDKKSDPTSGRKQKSYRRRRHEEERDERSEVGGEDGSEAGVPNQESKPSAHAPAPHARHDKSMARYPFSG